MVISQIIRGRYKRTDTASSSGLIQLKGIATKARAVARIPSQAMILDRCLMVML